MQYLQRIVVIPSHAAILPSEKAFAYKMRLDAMKLLVSRMVVLGGATLVEVTLNLKSEKEGKKVENI